MQAPQLAIAGGAAYILLSILEAIFLSRIAHPSLSKSLRIGVYLIINSSVFTMAIIPIDVAYTHSQNLQTLHRDNNKSIRNLRWLRYKKNLSYSKKLNKLKFNQHNPAYAGISRSILTPDTYRKLADYTNGSELNKKSKLNHVGIDKQLWFETALKAIWNIQQLNYMIVVATILPFSIGFHTHAWTCKEDILRFAKRFVKKVFVIVISICLPLSIIGYIFADYAKVIDVGNIRIEYTEDLNIPQEDSFTSLDITSNKTSGYNTINNFIEPERILYDTQLSKYRKYKHDFSFIKSTSEKSFYSVKFNNFLSLRRNNTKRQLHTLADIYSIAKAAYNEQLIQNDNLTEIIPIALKALASILLKLGFIFIQYAKSFVNLWGLIIAIAYLTHGLTREMYNAITHSSSTAEGHQLVLASVRLMKMSVKLRRLCKFQFTESQNGKLAGFVNQVKQFTKLKNHKYLAKETSDCNKNEKKLETFESEQNSFSLDLSSVEMFRNHLFASLLEPQILPYLHTHKYAYIRDKKLQTLNQHNIPVNEILGVTNMLSELNNIKDPNNISKSQRDIMNSSDNTCFNNDEKSLLLDLLQFLHQKLIKEDNAYEEALRICIVSYRLSVRRAHIFNQWAQWSQRRCNELQAHIILKKFIKDLSIFSLYASPEFNIIKSCAYCISFGDIFLRLNSPTVKMEGNKIKLSKVKEYNKSSSLNSDSRNYILSLRNNAIKDAERLSNDIKDTWSHWTHVIVTENNDRTYSVYLSSAPVISIDTGKRTNKYKRFKNTLYTIKNKCLVNFNVPILPQGKSLSSLYCLESENPSKTTKLLMMKTKELYSKRLQSRKNVKFSYRNEYRSNTFYRDLKTTNIAKKFTNVKLRHNPETLTYSSTKDSIDEENKLEIKLTELLKRKLMFFTNDNISWKKPKNMKIFYGLAYIYKTHIYIKSKTNTINKDHKKSKSNSIKSDKYQFFFKSRKYLFKSKYTRYFTRIAIDGLIRKNTRKDVLSFLVCFTRRTIPGNLKLRPSYRSSIPPNTRKIFSLIDENFNNNSERVLENQGQSNKSIQSKCDLDSLSPHKNDSIEITESDNIIALALPENDSIEITESDNIIALSASNKEHHMIPDINKKPEDLSSSVDILNHVMDTNTDTTELPDQNFISPQILESDKKLDNIRQSITLNKNNSDTDISPNSKSIIFAEENFLASDLQKMKISYIDSRNTTYKLLNLKHPLYQESCIHNFEESNFYNINSENSILKGKNQLFLEEYKNNITTEKTRDRELRFYFSSYSSLPKLNTLKNKIDQKIPNLSMKNELIQTSRRLARNLSNNSYKIDQPIKKVENSGFQIFRKENKKSTGQVINKSVLKEQEFKKPRKDLKKKKKWGIKEHQKYTPIIKTQNSIQNQSLLSNDLPNGERDIFKGRSCSIFLRSKKNKKGYTPLNGMRSLPKNESLISSISSLKPIFYPALYEYWLYILNNMPESLCVQINNFERTVLSGYSKKRSLFEYTPQEYSTKRKPINNKKNLSKTVLDKTLESLNKRATFESKNISINEYSPDLDHDRSANNFSLVLESLQNVLHSLNYERIYLPDESVEICLENQRYSKDVFISSYIICELYERIEWTINLTKNIKNVMTVLPKDFPRIQRYSLLCETRNLLRIKTFSYNLLKSILPFLDKKLNKNELDYKTLDKIIQKQKKNYNLNNVYKSNLRALQIKKHKVQIKYNRLKDIKCSMPFYINLLKRRNLSNSFLITYILRNKIIPPWLQINRKSFNIHNRVYRIKVSIPNDLIDILENTSTWIRFSGGIPVILIKDNRIFFKERSFYNRNKPRKYFTSRKPCNIYKQAKTKLICLRRGNNFTAFENNYKMGSILNDIFKNNSIITGNEIENFNKFKRHMFMSKDSSNAKKSQFISEKYFSDHLKNKELCISSSEVNCDVLFASLSCKGRSILKYILSTTNISKLISKQLKIFDSFYPNLKNLDINSDIAQSFSSTQSILFDKNKEKKNSYTSKPLVKSILNEKFNSHFSGIFSTYHSIAVAEVSILSKISYSRYIINSSKIIRSEDLVNILEINNSRKSKLIARFNTHNNLRDMSNIKAHHWFIPWRPKILPQNKKIKSKSLVYNELFPNKKILFASEELNTKMNSDILYNNKVLYYTSDRQRLYDIEKKKVPQVSDTSLYLQEYGSNISMSQIYSGFVISNIENSQDIQDQAYEEIYKKPLYEFKNYRKRSDFNISGHVIHKTKYKDKESNILLAQTLYNNIQYYLSSKSLNWNVQFNFKFSIFLIDVSKDYFTPNFSMKINLLLVKLYSKIDIFLVNNKYTNKQLCYFCPLYNKAKEFSSLFIFGADDSKPRNKSSRLAFPFQRSLRSNSLKSSKNIFKRFRRKKNSKIPYNEIENESCEQPNIENNHCKPIIDKQFLKIESPIVNCSIDILDSLDNKINDASNSLFKNSSDNSPNCDTNKNITTEHLNEEYKNLINMESKVDSNSLTSKNKTYLSVKTKIISQDQLENLSVETDNMSLKFNKEIEISTSDGIFSSNIGSSSQKNLENDGCNIEINKSLEQEVLRDLLDKFFLTNKLIKSKYLNTDLTDRTNQSYFKYKTKKERELNRFCKSRAHRFLVNLVNKDTKYTKLEQNKSSYKINKKISKFANSSNTDLILRDTETFHHKYKHSSLSITQNYKYLIGCQGLTSSVRTSQLTNVYLDILPASSRNQSILEIFSLQDILIKNIKWRYPDNSIYLKNNRFINLWKHVLPKSSYSTILCAITPWNRFSSQVLVQKPCLISNTKYTNDYLTTNKQNAIKYFNLAKLNYNNQKHYLLSSYYNHPILRNQPKLNTNVNIVTRLNKMSSIIEKYNEYLRNFKYNSDKPHKDIKNYTNTNLTNFHKSSKTLYDVIVFLSVYENVISLAERKKKASLIDSLNPFVKYKKKVSSTIINTKIIEQKKYEKLPLILDSVSKLQQARYKLPFKTRSNISSEHSTQLNTIINFLTLINYCNKYFSSISTKNKYIYILRLQKRKKNNTRILYKNLRHMKRNSTLSGLTGSLNIVSWRSKSMLDNSNHYPSIKYLKFSFKSRYQSSYPYIGNTYSAVDITNHEWTSIKKPIAVFEISRPKTIFKQLLLVYKKIYIIMKVILEAIYLTYGRALICYIKALFYLSTICIITYSEFRFALNPTGPPLITGTPIFIGLLCYNILFILVLLLIISVRRNTNDGEACILTNRNTDTVSLLWLTHHLTSVFSPVFYHTLQILGLRNTFYQQNLKSLALLPVVGVSWGILIPISWILFSLIAFIGFLLDHGRDVVVAKNLEQYLYHVIRSCEKPPNSLITKLGVKNLSSDVEPRKIHYSKFCKFCPPDDYVCDKVSNEIEAVLKTPALPPESASRVLNYLLTSFQSTKECCISPKFVFAENINNKSFRIKRPLISNYSYHIRHRTLNNNYRSNKVVNKQRVANVEKKKSVIYSIMVSRIEEFDKRNMFRLHNIFLSEYVKIKSASSIYYKHYFVNKKTHNFDTIPIKYPKSYIYNELKQTANNHKDKLNRFIKLEIKKLKTNNFETKKLERNNFETKNHNLINIDSKTTDIKKTALMNTQKRYTEKYKSIEQEKQFISQILSRFKNSIKLVFESPKYINEKKYSTPQLEKNLTHNYDINDNFLYNKINQRVPINENYCVHISPSRTDVLNSSPISSLESSNISQRRCSKRSVFSSKRIINETSNIKINNHIDTESNRNLDSQTYFYYIKDSNIDHEHDFLDYFKNIDTLNTEVKENIIDRSNEKLLFHNMKSSELQGQFESSSNNMKISGNMFELNLLKFYSKYIDNINYFKERISKSIIKINKQFLLIINKSQTSKLFSFSYIFCKTSWVLKFFFNFYCYCLNESLDIIIHKSDFEPFINIKSSKNSQFIFADTENGKPKCNNDLKTDLRHESEDNIGSKGIKKQFFLSALHYKNICTDNSELKHTKILPEDSEVSYETVSTNSNIKRYTNQCPIILKELQCIKKRQINLPSIVNWWTFVLGSDDVSPRADEPLRVALRFGYIIKHHLLPKLYFIINFIYTTVQRKFKFHSTKVDDYLEVLVV